MKKQNAVVNPPFSGRHAKPQTAKALAARKQRAQEKPCTIFRGVLVPKGVKHTRAELAGEKPNRSTIPHGKSAPIFVFFASFFP